MPQRSLRMMYRPGFLLLVRSGCEKLLHESHVLLRIMTV
jgi:hypothetical protein